MRIALLAAALVLSACATAPSAEAPAAQTQPQATASDSATARVARMLGSAGGANAPTQADVERALGAPDITRRDGAGAALTYRYQNCALLLLFAADSGNTMRLAQAHPSARRSGEAAPSLEQCAAESRVRN